jgi:signal transduction histidine kinase
VIIDDVRSDEPMARSYRDAITNAGLWGLAPFKVMRSWMAVPLVLKGEVIGMLTVSQTAPSFFTQDHARLARAFADQAAIAIENARLFEEAQGRARETETLFRADEGLFQSLDLDTVLQALVDITVDVMGADKSTVATWEGDSGHSALRAWRNIAPETREMLRTMYAGEPTRIGAPAIIITEDPKDAHPLEVPVITAEGIRSYIQVRVVSREGRGLGFFAVAYTREHKFSDEEQRLYIALAERAAIAIENARLFEERQKRTSELAALLEVSRAVASTLDTRALMAMILEQIKTIIDHTGSAIMTIADGELQIVDVRAIAGHEPEIGVRLPLEEPITGLWAAILRGEAVIIDDMRSDEPMAVDFRTQSEAAGLWELPNFQILRSWMGVPLTLKDEVIGVLAVSQVLPSYFKPEHARLVRAFADQAAIAIGNARLFEERQKRASELAALLEVSAAVGSTLDLAPLLELIMDHLRTVIDYAGGSLFLLEDDKITRLASRDPGQITGPTPPPQTAPPSYSLDQLKALWGLLTSGPVILDDVHDDSPTATAYRSVWGGNLEGTAVEYVTSLLAAPLVLKGEIIGVLVLGHREKGHFLPEDAELASVVAAHAASAIENARLFEQAQHGAALEERQRLARELHDSVSQALYGIALGARTARTLLDRDPSGAVEPIEYISSLADAGLTEMRALIFELRPESLETEGLVAAITKQAAAIQARHGIKIDCRFASEPELPLPLKETLYRIAQEALHNTVKHAKAANVALTLESKDGHFSVTIRDDGTGFDPSGEFPGHLGLRSMRERAEKSGGSLLVESAPAAGTTIRATFPV